MMDDRVFEVTPHDIRAQEFGREMRGYSRIEVDEFRERMAELLERLVRERVQQEERLKASQEQLRAFRERDRALNEALVAAQQLRADAEAQAGRRADEVLREARAEAQRLVELARGDERQVREKTQALVRQFGAYVAGYRALLERQLAELEALALHVRPPDDESKQ